MRVISQHGNVDLPYEQIFECLIGDMKSSSSGYGRYHVEGIK